MPIYEYRCEDCDKVFEVIQKISEKKLTKCKCSKKRFCSTNGIVVWF